MLMYNIKYFLFFSVAETMKKVISDMTLDKPGQDEL